MIQAMFVYEAFHYYMHPISLDEPAAKELPPRELGDKRVYTGKATLFSLPWKVLSRVLDRRVLLLHKLWIHEE